MKTKVIRSFGDYEFPVLLLAEVNTKIPFVIVKVNKHKERYDLRRRDEKAVRQAHRSACLIHVTQFHKFLSIENRKSVYRLSSEKVAQF